MVPQKQISQTELFQRLENRATLVTATRRLSRYLMRRYHHTRAASGETVWETPDILPYSAWLTRVQEQAGYQENPFSGKTAHEPVKTLLSPAQEHFVWEAIVRQSPYGSGLLRVSEAADMAARAREIACQWRLPIREPAMALPEETAAFLDWTHGFDQVCRKNHWQDGAGLGDAVIRLFSEARIEPPDQMVLAGFDEFSPMQADLIKTLEERGSQVFELRPPSVPGAVQRCALPDTLAEIQAAAQWARDRLSENPGARIGIVAPAIHALRPHLMRIFDDVLHPCFRMLPHTEKNRAYNVSLGLPLADYPVIRAALTILNFVWQDLPAAEYSLLLRSPFLGGGNDEISARAMLDARIREAGETAVSMADLMDFATPPPGKKNPRKMGCPLLHRHLSALKTAAETLPLNQPPSAWRMDFAGLLTSAGWPGERRLSSEEVQTLAAWNDVLQEFAALDRVCGALNGEEAVRLLFRQAGSRIFQPETGDAPVQILGILEAAGETFDFLWIMGMDADSWPPAPAPNPFLPKAMQKTYNVPHASPERELAWARQITRRLIASADKVMVSFPEKQEDTVLNPSPLIRGLSEGSVKLPPRPWWAVTPDVADFEEIADQTGPAAAPGIRMTGGTGLLKAQAACPFSAFARYRLHAKALETPESGLNARERGSLVHKVLERFWDQVKTRDALVALSEAALSDIIDKAVTRAVSAMAEKYPRRFPEQFTKLEKERLMLLAKAFVAVDGQRPAFSVTCREEKLACTLSGIELTTYADRIDTLEDGRVVIVDYKTGDPKVSDWFTNRLADPQLPLYSMVAPWEVAAVVFGRVKKGAAGYIGVAASEAIVPGAAWPGAKKSPVAHFSDFAEVIGLWKGKIEFLAKEVRQGIATVSPVSVNTSCRYCDLGPLCRIREQGTGQDIDQNIDPGTDRKEEGEQQNDG